MPKSTNQPQTSLKEMLNSVKTAKFRGVPIKCKSLSLAELIELQEIYPEWDSFDISELVGDNSNIIQQLKLFATIVWLGARKHEPELAELENCYELFNLELLSDKDIMVDLLGLISAITNVDLVSTSTVDDDEPPPAPDKPEKKKSAEGNE